MSQGSVIIATSIVASLAIVGLILWLAWPIEWMPHGHCFYWAPWILWPTVISDAVIAVAYFVIPAALWSMAKRSTGLNAMLRRMFSAFILACGITHVTDIIVVWWPAYEVLAFVRAATACISLATAYALIKNGSALMIAELTPAQLETEGALDRVEKRLGKMGLNGGGG